MRQVHPLIHSGPRRGAVPNRRPFVRVRQRVGPLLA